MPVRAPDEGRAQQQLGFAIIKYVHRFSFMPGKMPPFDQRRATKPAADASRAAVRKSSTERNPLPVRMAASSRFGVTKVARGSNAASIILIAAGLSSLVPLVATMTGSTTSGSSGRRFKNSTTTRMMAVEYSIPVFTAAGGSSANTASICRRTMSVRQA